jgi:1,2-diacylglycerol 3-alpha-glucosyltransferase
MIKIGFFIDTYFPMIDGVIMVIDNYARRMSKAADITVFAADCGDYDFSTLPYRVVRCKTLPVSRLDYGLPLPFLDRAFQKTLEEAELDIVHIHSPATVGKAGLRYARLHGIPAIATLHSQFKTDYQRILKSEALVQLALRVTTAFYDSADECWTVNSAMAKRYTEEYGGKLQPHVIKNATELLPCADLTQSRRRINERYQLRDDEKVFLFVGRIDTLKNIFLIAEAMQLLKQQNKFPFKMLFVGSGKDAPALEAEIARLGIEENVILCGRISDRTLLAEHYARADLFLFPSLYDTNSLVQIEAASQKTPTVFVRGSVTSTTVTENENGFFCDATKEALAEKIVEIIEDPALYQTVAEHAFRDLYQTWDDTVQEAYGRYCMLIRKYRADWGVPFSTQSEIA